MNSYILKKSTADIRYQMPYGDGVRGGGGCGPCKWAQAGPVLFCQRSGCAPYCGPRGAIIQY